MLYLGIPLSIIMFFGFKINSFIYKSFYNNNKWTDWVYGILLMPSLAYALWWLGCFIIFGLINEFENHGFQLFLFAISLILILYLWYVTNKAVDDRKWDDELAKIAEAKQKTDEEIELTINSAK